MFIFIWLIIIKILYYLINFVFLLAICCELILILLFLHSIINNLNCCLILQVCYYDIHFRFRFFIGLMTYFILMLLALGLLLYRILQSEFSMILFFCYSFLSYLSLVYNNNNLYQSIYFHYLNLNSHLLIIYQSK